MKPKEEPSSKTLLSVTAEVPVVFMTTWFQQSPGWGPINKRRLLFLILLLDISSEMEEFDAQPYDFFF